MLTNIYNLPEPVFEAVKSDAYDNQGSDITVTSLINPPQLVQLTKRHQDKIDEDVTERLWATYGQLMHGLLERSIKGKPEMEARYLTENRVFAKVNDWKVSGQFDLYDKQTETLYDYKFVGGYAVKMALKEGKDEWEQQLNLLRALFFMERGILAKKVAIVGLVRDFSYRNLAEGIFPVQTIDFKAWPLEDAQTYLFERVKLHQEAVKLPDGQLPMCSDEERWYRSGKYARCQQYCPARSVCLFGKSLQRG